MTMKPIPNDHPTATPYFVVKDAKQFTAFLKNVLGAIEQYICRHEDKIVNAGYHIGNSLIMFGESGEQSMKMNCSLYVYVDDVDAVYKKAMAFGAKSLVEPSDKLYGDRMGGVQDAEGNYWWIATRVEELTAEEIQKRVDEQKK